MGCPSLVHQVLQPEISGLGQISDSHTATDAHIFACGYTNIHTAYLVVCVCGHIYCLLPTWTTILAIKIVSSIWLSYHLNQIKVRKCI